VFLEAFEGRSICCCNLIRRRNLAILDIPIAEITRQYVQYIGVMQELQLELAGEYLVMAATLAEIKSRMLLPRPPLSGEDSDEDPRAELVRRLQEYERFKSAAENIDRPAASGARCLECERRHQRPQGGAGFLPQTTLQEMLVAFKEVVVRAEFFAASPRAARAPLGARTHDGYSHFTRREPFRRIQRALSRRRGAHGRDRDLCPQSLSCVREELIEIVQAQRLRPCTCAPRRRTRRYVWSRLPPANEVGS